MSRLKDRFQKWKEERSTWQKAGDVFFWVFILLLLVPGPRKAVSTGVNRAILLIKTPGMLAQEKQVELGDSDLQWTIRDGEGNLLQLADFEGQPVFLNFWATWCPPCVAELPEIQKAYEKHGEDVAFLLVTNEEAEKVDAFLEKHGYDLPVSYATSALPPSLQHASIPTTYILSPEGIIVVKKTGAVNWDSRGTDRIFEALIR